MNTDRVLVIGYGNALRGDDAVGPDVADAVRGDPRVAGAQIISCTQLTPELAEDMGAADLVVLVDARVDHLAAGSVRVETVTPGERSSSTHRVDAGDLIELTRVVFGETPKVMVVSVETVTFAFGDGLSPEVAAAVPVMIEAVVRLVERASLSPPT